MIMKRIFLLLVLSACALVHGQEALDWQMVKNDGKSGGIPVLETSEKALCLRTRTMGKLNVGKVDFRIFNKRGFRATEDFQIDFEYQGNQLKFYQFVDYLDQFHVITYFFNSGKNEYFFFLQKLNDNGSLGEPIVLGKTKKSGGSLKQKLTNLYRDKLYVSHQIRAAVSEDKNYFAFIIPSNLDFTGNELTSWKLVTLDKNGEKIEISFDEKNENSFYNGLSVSNSGEVFGIEMTGLLYNPLPFFLNTFEDFLVTREVNEFYASSIEAVYFNLEDEDIEKIDVVKNPEVYYNVKTTIKNGQFYVYGIGEEQDKFKPVDYFCYEFDINSFSGKNGRLYKLSEQELGSENKKSEGRFTKAEYGKEVYNILSNLVIDQQGVPYFTMQPFVPKEVYVQTQNGMRVEKHYIYYDIFVLSTSSKDSKCSRIEAEQDLKNFYVQGYHVFGLVDQMPTVFYLNKGKNAVINGAAIAGRKGQDTFQKVSIKGSGELSFEEIIGGDEKTLALLFVYSTEIKEGEVVFYGVAKRSKSNTVYAKYGA